MNGPAAARPGATPDTGDGLPAPRPADDDGRITLELRVNNKRHRVKARAHHTLLDVLRGELRLTGTREGCGIGMCGACTVLVDGKPLSGCLLLAVLAEGKELTTIEGLEGPDQQLDVTQQTFSDHTAFQCSYCTPGFVLATKALLAEVPDPSPEDAKEYLAGNLCRCGSYCKIVDAVMDAAGRLRVAGGEDR